MFMFSVILFVSPKICASIRVYTCTVSIYVNSWSRLVD